MSTRGVVLDIETAPDPSALAAVAQTGQAARGSVWLHRLVAVSLFEFSETDKGEFGDFRLVSLLAAPDAPRARGPHEAAALKRIDVSLGALGGDGVLISFNGRRHDLPFLRMRRLRNGLFKASALDRFVGKGATGHVDMMDVLAGDGLHWPSLEHACAALDIPHSAHRAISRVPAVQRKAETDVLATFLLYLVSQAAQRQSRRCVLTGWTALAGWCLAGPDEAHLRQFATRETTRAALQGTRAR